MTLLKHKDWNPEVKRALNDMIKANKVLNNNGTVTVLPETNLEYTLIIAASASGLPIEFFKTLVPKDAMKVKNRVTSFFFGEE